MIGIATVPCLHYFTGGQNWGGAMIGRVVALSIAAVTVSGCVTERSGADFVSMSQKIGPPKAGQARIVVFREKGYGGIGDQGWDVKLDGQPMSDLKTGTYAYADRPAGSHQLSSTMAMFPGVTQRDVGAASGRTYFFIARLSDGYKSLNAMSAAGGLAGLVIASAVTSGDSNPGPLDFFPMEEGAARAAISDLRLAE
jgi:hypothetical protein